jgi:simple sugar transport system ATP-binding protein
MTQSPLVEVRNIHKWFGKVHAVDGVSFSIEKGELVGLVGDNGAGKSTLIKVLSGFHPSDEGEILIEGRKVQIKSPSDARAFGIETVYQEQALVELMSVSRNMFMGREPVRFARFLNLRKMKDCMKVLHNLGLSIGSPDLPVGNLSGGEKQGVAIARAMYFKAKLVIFDEPTRNLSVKEAQTVLDFIEGLKKENISVIFITHNLHHVYSVVERFLAIRKGQLVDDVRKEDTSIEKLTQELSK